MHHTGVKDDAIFEHGVTDDGAAQDQYGKKGFEHKPEREGDKHGIECRNQHQRDRDGESGFDVTQLTEHRIEVQKDRPVKNQREKEHKQQIGLQHTERYTHTSLLNTGLQSRSSKRKQRSQRRK